MPHAEIVGIDPNPRAVAKARMQDSSPLSHYRVATTPEPGEMFAAILAMAVFRHGEIERQKPANCEEILPFSDFASSLLRLDAALAVGGFLALGNAHFRLSDTCLSDRFGVELRLSKDPPPASLLYGNDSCRLTGVIEDAVLFSKKSSRIRTEGEQGV